MLSLIGCSHLASDLPSLQLPYIGCGHFTSLTVAALHLTCPSYLSCVAAALHWTYASYLSAATILHWTCPVFSR